MRVTNSLSNDSEGNQLTSDQRGFDRVADGDDNGPATVDIGATEFIPRSNNHRGHHR